MSRPTLEVAGIVRKTGNRYLEQQKSHLAWPHRKVLDAIVPCRTGPLGGHRDQCVQRFRRDLRWAFPWPRTLSRPARLRV